MELAPKALSNASLSACLLSYPPKKYGIRPVGRVAPRPPEMEFTHLFSGGEGTRRPTNCGRLSQLHTQCSEKQGSGNQYEFVLHSFFIS